MDKPRYDQSSKYKKPYPDNLELANAIENSYAGNDSAEREKRRQEELKRSWQYMAQKYESGEIKPDSDWAIAARIHRASQTQNDNLTKRVKECRLQLEREEKIADVLRQKQELGQSETEFQEELEKLRTDFKKIIDSTR